MISEKLSKAREYERVYGEKITADERPLFHVSPYVGWMNDPNGFSLYKGEYHLFYQYYPYDNNWGPMHWGHVVTKDFIKWEFLPAVLAPDTDIDKDGCWSGSAIETEDGKHALIYTGLVVNIDADGNKTVLQRQCIAIGDGRDYVKYEGNPVIDRKLLPAGGSTEDFRDPQIWYDQEEKAYYLVVGDRSEDGSGMILMYRSLDLKDWSFVTILDRCNNEFGRMWECPNFFQLEDHAVLLVSPQEMRPDGLEYHGGNGTVCLIGDYEKKSHTFTRKHTQCIDKGLDFYAPQITIAEDGRRIMVGWMQSWESCRNQPLNNKYFGMMTIPRELSVQNGRLYQKPVRELENYRANHISYEQVEVGEDEVVLDQIAGRVADITVDIHMEQSGTEDGFTIALAKDHENDCKICYNPTTGILSFDRSNSGFNYDIVNKRVIQTSTGSVKLRMILDRFSVEIFVNDGEDVLSNTIYTPVSATGISFMAKGKAYMDISKWDIMNDEA